MSACQTGTLSEIALNLRVPEIKDLMAANQGSGDAAFPNLSRAMAGLGLTTSRPLIGDYEPINGKSGEGSSPESQTTPAKVPPTRAAQSGSNADKSGANNAEDVLPPPTTTGGVAINVTL